MNFDLPDDHELIRRTVRDFAEGEVAPVAEELDRTKAFPYAIVKQLGELGLMGIPFPEEYGGGGGDSLAYAIAVEELTRVDSSVAITLCAHTSLGTQPIYLFGTEEQKQEWMPRLTSGEILGAFGLTEPEAGSDAGNVRTRASLEDGEWTINGTKQFITNAGTDISGVVCITARTGDDEISNLIVAERHAGLLAGRAVPQDGLERVRHAAADLRGLHRARGEPARPARRRLQAVPAGARHRPHRRRGDGRRPRAGRAGSGAGLRQGAARVRQADLQVPGDPGQARRHGDRDRGRAAARLQGRAR